jgi:TRAP transporter TAXI family solute receptor
VTKKFEKQGVGASFSALAIIATVVSLTMLVSGIYFYRVVSSDVDFRHIVIATGPETGTYYSLGTALKRVLNNSKKFDGVDIITTDGSEENINLIRNSKGDVDLAFVQADISPSTNARLVATLYDEVLHIMVSKAAGSDIKTIYDLQGKRISLGSAGSGTRNLSARVMRHFGIKPSHDIELGPADAASQLAAGSIDAAFLLSAIPSRLVMELAAQDAIQFLSLGGVEEDGDEAHALELVFPGVVRDIIPRSTYVRLPRNPVHTVSVAATLVARDDVDEDLVRYITAAIFENRSGDAGLEGSGLTVARKIRENFHPATAALPYHSGAAAYYQRKEPPFFVEYAEALSLSLTIILTLYSVFIALREWTRRRMKNRVDAYLLKVEELVLDCEKLNRDQLITQKNALERLRRDVFSDLIDERLLADQALIILQNHLRDELAELKSLIKAKPID